MRKMAENDTISEPGNLVAIVEDDETIGDLLTEIIEEETPYHATLASDSVQTLELIKTVKPSLFIIDYLLPDTDGLALYDQIRTIEAYKHTPVIFISASPPEAELRKRGIRWIKKPFLLEGLLQIIEQYLS
jgi:CheY-like chemotaxis protein